MTKAGKSKRYLKFTYNDGTSLQLELARVTVLDKPLDKVGLHIDHVGDSKYLMIANIAFLPDDKRLDNITIVREDENTNT